MSQNDENLSALLKQWRDLEPKANFEANVWRHIRLAQAEQPERSSLLELGLRQWIPQPALSMAAAVVVAILIGSWSGLHSVRPPASVSQAPLTFLAPDTLTGGYLQLTKGEAQ